jgi:CHAT domain-containing protein
MVECYLFLNRYVEASDLARAVIADHRTQGDSYKLARTLLFLATAEAKLTNFGATEAALAEAETYFVALGVAPLVAITHLWRGEVALHQGNLATAFREATTAADSFESGGQQVDYATATLLRGRVSFALRDYASAKAAGEAALKIAQKYNVPWLRYSAHYLLGQIAEAGQNTARAMWRYQAAAATIDRLQRGLTITLRPGFLEDKADALQALIGLYLRSGDAANAFVTLEHAKSQVLLGYLANREQFHWAQSDPHNRALIDELNRLRIEHQGFYSLAYDAPQDIKRPHAIPPEQALAEVAVRERRMRAITEQLYLYSGTAEGRSNPAPGVTLPEIQATLQEGMLLLEFYNDGTDWWAFTLNADAIEAHPLPITVKEFNQLLAQLRVNLTAALKVGPQTGSTPALTRLTQRLLHRLYQGLLEPLNLHERALNRLVIVPYGPLHYLPFHLLHDGQAYLIQRFETTILPSAGLTCQPNPRRARGASVIEHSHAGQLQHTHAEAHMVRELFGGTLHDGDMANRAVFQGPPTQILHIAAHGQHRPAQPDLSYIQLADGQLFADDLLQHDLSYELVTLSACETGQANVSGGDELIGLGRGFLYAGAGALLVSLWPVADAMTVEFMEHVYRALLGGASKAAALRNAQLALLKTNAFLHPAYWGAFQLIGNPDPLSRPAQSS